MSRGTAGQQTAASTKIQGSRASLKPTEIEQKSFDIIARRVNLGAFPAAVRPIVARVVHATGDVHMARLLQFHPQAVSTALKAIRAGAQIVTDVNMVKAGINSSLLRLHGNKVHCAIGRASIAARARRDGMTRAAAAVLLSKRLIQNGIVVIGNAPTALFALLDLIAAGVRPALIVGVPVGFVGAAEAKRALEKCDVPYITLRGTRGGSSVAAAIMNALLALADKNSK